MTAPDDTTPARTRVLLADDHPLVRAGVRRVIEAVAHLECVGETGSGAETLRFLRATPVDVLILDLNMPDGDGFSVLREASTVAPDTRIVVLTMHAQPEYVTRAVREGANGYLLKDLAVQDLVAAIDSVMAGGSFFSERAQRALAESVRTGGASESALARLTGREREVLAAVARGLTTKEIAAAQNISTRTVESHRANLMRKLDLHSVALLTQFAIREGLIEGPDGAP
ncbi:MAG: response regulator transcription factor [Candidatus Eisenbacteria bacterium]|jgi:DNA-binding NarL/FixJ family response regulator|nr:response regulator transcription factor [Candidatus Eisenbacteria bacterium]